MKHSNGRTNCDKCQEEITDNQRKQGETLHYGRTDYHAGCYVDFLRTHNALLQQEEVV